MACNIIYLHFKFLLVFLTETEKIIFCRRKHMRVSKVVETYLFLNVYCMREKKALTLFKDTSIAIVKEP